MSPHEDVVILIAEPHPKAQDSLTSLLSRRYRIVTAQDCVMMMARVQTQPLPDLILLDLRMQFFDVCKACAYLRSQANIPIAIVSRDLEKADKEMVDTCHFECAMIFPGNETELMECVDRMLVEAVMARQKQSVCQESQYKLDNISRSLIDYSIDALIIANLHGQIVEFNRAAEILFGFSRANSIGRGIMEFLVPSEYGSAHMQGLASLRNQKGLTPRFLKRIKASALCAGNARLDIEISLSLIDVNMEMYCVASIRDMTASKQMAKALHETLAVAEHNVTKKDIELERVKRSERNATISLQTQQVVNHLLHLSLENYSLEKKLQMALGFVSKLPWLIHGDNWLGIYLKKDNTDHEFELIADTPAGRLPFNYRCQYASNECSNCMISLHVNPLLSVFESPGHQFTKEQIDGKVDYCIPLLSESQNIGLLRIIIPAQTIQGVFDNLMFDSIGKVIVNLVIRSRMDQALKVSKKEAEIANRSKSEFLANMSHEIRSPLNAIIGMTDLVLSTSLSREEMLGNLEIVRSSSLSLLDLINSILDLSKIEAGHFQLEHIAFDLLGQLEGVCEMLAIKAHQKGLSLYNRIPPGLPRTLEGDPVRLKQILINLINNAIKFTSSGEIVLAVEHAQVHEATSNQELYLRFSVTDTGIGIPDALQNKIFQSFVQADGSIARKYGGTGLGLTISRHLVEMMGGTLQVESQEDQGSSFFFTIPLALARQSDALEPWMKPRRSDQTHTEHAPLQGRRILLADGHRTGAEIVENLLRHHGARVTLASDQMEFIAQMEQQIDDPFDLLLVDETIAQGCDCLARDSCAYYQSRIIVMVSSHLTSQNFILKGILQKIEIIKKPVRQFLLLKKIERLLVPNVGHSEEDESVSTFRTIPKPQQPLDILLVEDLPANQKLAKDILTLQGHRVMIANNGVEALDLLKGGSRFDLILMDLQMPIMDGFETTRRIRNGDPAEVGNPHVPIIAVSAMVMMNEKMQCYEIGMSGFLLKPYQTHELLHAVSSFVKVRKPAVRKPVSGAIVLSPVDTDAETLNHFKKTFAVEVQDHMRQLQQSLMQRDLGDLVREGNWLRTMAGHIGANRLASHAIRLTGQAEMDAWEDALTMYPNLEQYVEALVQHLAKDGVA
ncbi:MAG: response regulator [Magnetococcales bacterium]|nr:response regulator [Magnetococcales bacterium]